MDSGHLVFEQPWALCLLILWAVLPLLFYAWHKNSLDRLIAFSATAAIQHKQQLSKGYRRLVYWLLLWLAAFCILLIPAEPVLKAKTPKTSVDMMLALDISLSMKATDIPPSRLEAAKKAAIEFASSLPSSVRIGLVFFAGDAMLVSPPTEDHDRVVELLKSLKKDDTLPRTELGGAIVMAQKALDANVSLPKGNTNQKPRRVLILLSDGDSQEGYPWSEASSQAAKNRIVIQTIGVGTDHAADIEYQGTRYPVFFSENTLRQIAEITHGSYQRVSEVKDFTRAYQRIADTTIEWRWEKTNLSSWLVWLSLVLLLLAFLAEWLWIQRLRKPLHLVK
ncbi:MAG: VWA domain-containing protein [Cyanobacteria bacterium]|nr:VWA domain-containing protein [Cyanobacteriota bacterium]